MSQGFRRRLLASLLVVASIVLTLAGCDWLIGPPDDPGAGSSEIVEVGVVDGLPAVELGDGRVFLLDRLEDWDEYLDRFAPQEPLLGLGSLRLEPKDLPDEVDLRPYQTPLRTQVGGTCVQFATTAAIEARLRRHYSGMYNLSERFGQLIQKMAWLSENLEPMPSCRENQLGAWGGGNLTYQLRLFTRYRLPLEEHLPYSEITDPGIDWEAGHCLAGSNQRAMDDYNLDTMNLSPVALENAGWRAEAVEFCPGGSLRDPAWYEGVLADGYEVVFAARLPCGTDPSPGDGVWDPVAGASCGGHAMLMVGYRHDDRVFIVKNSWGYETANGDLGFTLMSYDWVEDGHVGEAAYITAVSVDPDYPFHDHMLLGRWNLDHDGWKGTLDITRFPGTFDSGAIHGETDRRIGTYWGPDGVARRVNGTIEGQEIEFWIDWDSPILDYGDIRGMRFTGYLFSWDFETLAGTMLDNRDGQTYGFYGTKGNWLAGSGVGGAPRAESYLGRWSMNHDGWLGTLDLTSVVPQTTVPGFTSLNGTYTPQGGSPLVVTARVSQLNPREFFLSIPFDAGDPQWFHGYLYSHETGILSGTTEWNAQLFGFVARREGDAP